MAEELDDEDRVAFEAVEQVIIEFQNIDPKSDGFRFQSEMKQFNIDLRNMKEVMERVSAFLDSLSDWWAAGIDAKF